MEEMRDLIAKNALFAGLPDSTIELAAGCAQNVAFDPGVRILAEGEPADTLYLLRRGRVSLQVQRPSGKPLVIETIGPNSVLGWSWLVPPYRWQFDGVAIDPVGAVAIDGTCLRAKADEDPVFGYALLKRISSVLLSRLQATRVRLLDLYGDRLDD
ncbi:MAG: cyclic nucleotide-binding domain-containing protein [Acidimicrobiales bacterium]|jgi:CRP-like cAMP-binding protein